MIKRSFFAAGRRPLRRTPRDEALSASRGMVTAELAIGILSATMLAIFLCWGVSIVVVHTEVTDVAAQIARADARGDKASSAEAKTHAPDGATIEVEKTGDQVRVSVSVPVTYGHFITINVKGHATMPREPGS